MYRKPLAVALVPLVLLTAGCGSHHAQAGAPAPSVTASAASGASEITTQPTKATDAAQAPSANLPAAVAQLVSLSTPDAASIAAARALLPDLPVKGLAPKTGYKGHRTDLFGSAWTDNQDAPLGHNGCGTANDVKKRDLTDVTYKSGKCMVATGTLVDPWTGKTIAYKATVADGAKLQIDHVRALGELWTHGAQNWTQAERVRWANHPANLRAVDGPANGSHSDRTPAAWMPPNKGTGWCEFSTRFVVVTAEMNRTIKPANGSPAAWVSQADKDMLARGLAMCPK